LFNLECEPVGDVSITIVDIYGVVVRKFQTYKSDFVHEEPIYLTELGTGIYFVKVEVDGINVDSQKLIIQ